MKRRVFGAVLIAWLAAAFGAADAHGFTLRGTVVGADGAPVSEGSTSFGQFWGGSREYAGRFEAQIPEVPPGRYPLVYTSDGGLLAFTVVPVEAGQREAEVTLRAGEDLVAKGRVVSADMPDGVPNAQVTVEGTVGGKPWKYTWLADEHGGFALYGKGLAGFGVTATAPYHQPSASAAIAAPLPRQMELRVPRETLIIGQVVTAEFGFLGPEATIGAIGTRQGMWQKTDAQGRFEFSALPPGDYVIWGFAPGRAPGGATLRLAPEQQVVGLTLHLPLAQAVSASGRVLGPDGETGVPGATVEFAQRLVAPSATGERRGSFGAGFAPEATYTAVTGPDGGYSVNIPHFAPGVAAAEIPVTIRAEGYVPRYYIVYQEALSAGPVNFQVFRGGRLHGTVRTLDGQPLPEGTRVMVQVPHGLVGPPGSGGGSVTYPTALDLATGRFDFGLVQPGENWILVEIHRDRIAQLKVNVIEGGDQEVEVVATPAGAATPQPGGR